MSKTPFMQLYVADYLGDTRHLTTEQHGAYLLLLMAMWRAGGALPEDHRKLSRICGVSPRRWHLISREVLEFFDTDNGILTQERLKREYEKATSISEKRSSSGRLGGLAKSLKENANAIANAAVLVEHSQKPEPDIDNTPIVPKGTRRSKSIDPKVYSEFEEMVWKEFPRHPNSRKEPAFKKYQDLTPEQRSRCIGGAARYSIRFEETVDHKRTVEERLNFVPHLVTWINQKGWESEYDQQG